MADLAHVFGGDLQLSATGDLAVSTGTEAVTERVARLNPALNAFVVMNPKALEAAAESTMRRQARRTPAHWTILAYCCGMCAAGCTSRSKEQRHSNLCRFFTFSVRPVRGKPPLCCGPGSILNCWQGGLVRRRELLKTAAAAALMTAAAPRLGRGADRSKTLVFVPTSDLTILDPVVTGARPTRNSAYLVFDTLVAVDNEGHYHPQMLQGWDISADGLTYTFHLRDGLQWSDGTPVAGQQTTFAFDDIGNRTSAASGGDRKTMGRI